MMARLRTAQRAGLELRSTGIVIPLLTWLKDFGRAMTAYQVVASGGDVNLLFVADNAAPGTQSVIAGFKQEMAACTRCTSKLVEHSFEQIAGGLSQLVQTELLRDPTSTRSASPTTPCSTRGSPRALARPSARAATSS
jgi:hypothetical protein